MAKLLLIEDDLELGSQLSSWLVTEGHVLEHVGSGEDGLQLLEHFAYDVILLDWTLPQLSGLDVCKRYRQVGGNAFIVFLTGKADIVSKEQALNIGADDYLTKPFDFRELQARINSLLRRPVGFLKDELRIGDLSLDVKEREVTVNGHTIHLMPKESALLEYLMRHPNRTFGSKDLLRSVWPSDRETTPETIRSWMRKLRTSLDLLGHGALIKTMGRSGYMIELDPDN